VVTDYEDAMPGNRRDHGVFSKRRAAGRRSAFSGECNAVWRFGTAIA